MRPLRRPRPSRRYASAAALFTLLAVASGLSVVASPASGYAPATVKVVLERIEQRGCTDSLSGSDFYADIRINGNTKEFPRIDGEDDIDPNWTHEVEVDTDEFATVPIRVRVGEFDNFLNFGDDQCDLTAGPGDDLELTLDTRFCDISGHLTGTCGQLETTGGGGESVFLRLRVEVIQAPVPEAGVGVRCLHSPLWPEEGDDVTITAEALDAGLQVGDTYVDESKQPNPAPPLVDRTVTADEIEIWVDGQSGPAKYTTAATQTTLQIDNVTPGDLVYSCRVRHQTEESFTGWRRTRVGPPAQGDAIPVVYTGPSSGRADVVFVADESDYGSAEDDDFLAGAANAIAGAYYGQDYFLARQRDFNFWLADEVGDAERDAADKCILTKPDNWDDAYSFADAGAILHSSVFRDCASNGLFSTEPNSLGTVLHETGHRPFGLADEYCCDGGYWQAETLPNVYESEDACGDDAPDLGRTADDCRSFTETHEAGRDLWLSDPVTDLMNASRRPPEVADIRRIDWFFGKCADHEC